MSPSGLASESPAVTLLGRLVDRLGQHAVAGRILGDPQRLQDRDAVVQQRAEDAGEARQGNS